MSTFQILSQGRTLLSLFAYVRANDNTSTSTEWSPAQFEEIQLQVGATGFPTVCVNLC